MQIEVVRLRAGRLTRFLAPSRSRQRGQRMMSEEVGDAFYKRADEFINLANGQRNSITRGKVSATFMYGRASYTAYVSACSFSTTAEMQAAEEETVAYFLELFESAFRDNLRDYISNFDNYIKQSVSSGPNPRLFTNSSPADHLVNGSNDPALVALRQHGYANPQQRCPHGHQIEGIRVNRNARDGKVRRQRVISRCVIASLHQSHHNPVGSRTQPGRLDLHAEGNLDAFAWIFENRELCQASLTSSEIRPTKAPCQHGWRSGQKLLDPTPRRTPVSVSALVR